MGHPLLKGFRCQVSGVSGFSMGHGAKGMESFEFGSGNAEVGKSKTKYETLYTKHRFDLQSAIEFLTPET
jgi:hypothetical protein